MQPKVDVRRRKQLKEVAGKKTTNGKQLPVDDKSRVRAGDWAAELDICINTAPSK